MTDHHDIKSEVRRYLIVFAALGLLTVITVTISYLRLPLRVAVVLALFVAIVKASLVAAYFMHLISEKKAIYALLILAAVLFSGLLLLPYLEGLSVPHGTVSPKGGSPTVGTHAEHEPDTQKHQDQDGGH